MACLEERHPQDEYFVGICLTDARNENCNSTYESNLDCEYCQPSRTSNVEKDGVHINSYDSDSSAELDLECGSLDVKVIVEKSGKDCRICFMNLDTYSKELGIPILLGCSCNGDLSFAHQKCAEKWFKIKGNKICEICGSIVKNLVGIKDIASTGNSIKSGNNAAATTETERFFHGYRLVNCILSGMLLAIVLFWFLGWDKNPK